MSGKTQLFKNLKNFRLITFDVTDTLLRFRYPPPIQYAKTATELGVKNINQEQLNECLRKEIKAMAIAHPNFGRSTNLGWQQWWIQLVKNVFRHVTPSIPPEQLDVLAETLLREYRTKEYWSYMEGSVELVQKIRDADKFVGIISNFDPSLSTVLREMEIEHLFDFILTSYEAGAQKPDAKIFSIPLERCKIKPNEALHIGNMYEIDYIGAKNSGWSSLLISQDSNKYENVEIMHVYASIKDVINALENKDIKW